MLLRVKPDGPVYEVKFTSQLIGVSENTKSTQLQTYTAPHTVVSASVSNACPVSSVSASASVVRDASL